MGGLRGDRARALRRRGPAVPPRGDGWAARGLRVRVTAPGAVVVARGDELVVEWTVEGSAGLEWTVVVDDPEAVFTAAAAVVPSPEVVCDDPRVARSSAARSRT
ncbi:hypothetical protein ACFQV2_31145 [Actinokineospora soli]|uniref:Uncharacterized protein n=1 Tax=Actinokineospora soli TaxID=1048753 RepID=A0ABW2TV65_9PSEU